MNDWEFRRHPTQKPVALIERCLLASTRAGDCVLDPFMGGGTRAVAALKLNRGFVEIELDWQHAPLEVLNSNLSVKNEVLQKLNSGWRDCSTA